MKPDSSLPTLSRSQFLRGCLAAALVGTAGTARGAETALRSRPIPSSGEALPVVGLGTWQAFDVGRDPAERAQRREVLQLLLDGGGRVIDSSPMYGRAEQVVGDLLRDLGRRDEAFLATKVWTRGRAAGIGQMTESAEKLGSPMIDLMQVHNLVDVESHLPTLREMKAAGRIRYIGITHYTSGALDRLTGLLAREEIDFVQMAYSIGVRAAEKRLLPAAAERGVAVLVNRPYEGGGAFSRVRGKPLPGWAADFDCASWGQFFVKFILAHPAVTCVIPGTRKPKHLLDNLGAGRGRLPNDKERQRMIEYWETL